LQLIIGYKKKKVLEDNQTIKIPQLQLLSTPQHTKIKTQPIINQ
jgi:hypothetical protein